MQTGHNYCTVSRLEMFLSLISFLIISILIIGQTESHNLDLEFLAVVFRHGDRIPTSEYEQYPNNPNNEYDFYPVSKGGLTNTGKMRAYKLGQHLRSLYDNFLGDYYTPEHLVARSTEYDRAKMSLQTLLSALYPPKSEQIWNKDLNWQPIPFIYLPRAFDVLMMPEECPQYKDELERIRNLPEILNKVEKFRPLMEKLTIQTGKLINSTTDLYYLYHSLMGEYMEGLKLPEWTYDIFPEGLLLDATILEYNQYHYNKKLKRLNGGMFIKHFVDIMTDIIESENSEKPPVNLFSGHEINIVALLNVLGIFEPLVPPYSSGVFIELLSNETDNYVGVRHYLGIPSTSIEKQIPSCLNPCPFGDFMTLMKDLIPSDEEMECQKGGLFYHDPIIHK